MGFFAFALTLQASFFGKLLKVSPLVGTIALIACALWNPLSGYGPQCYLASYVSEQLQRAESATSIAVAELRKRVKKDETVLVSPNHMAGSIIHYLGDKVLVCNMLTERDSYLLRCHPDLPAYLYSHAIPPDWMVRFGFEQGNREEHLMRLVSKIEKNQYELVHVATNGVDATRPEIFLRSFGARRTDNPMNYLQIWKRKY